MIEAITSGLTALDGLFGGGSGEAPTTFAPSQTIGTYNKTTGPIIESMKIPPAWSGMNPVYLWLGGAVLLFIFSLMFREHRRG